jgi:glycosyltransferase involved in cell wall biosynthesis
MSVAATSRPLGYVVTHYPKLSQTFVANEIAELRRHGIDVVPFSLNAPDESDLRTDAARHEQQRTFYIKAAGPVPMLRAALRCVAKDLGGTARFTVGALRSAGWDLKGLAWRAFHVAEAMLVREHCRRNSIDHLHAQFGQATATVAWLAHELDVAIGDGSLTWSFTIHGFQDFVNEGQTRLDLKAASAQFVVCVSDFTRSQLMRVTDPDDWDRFHVVRCGIDFDRFAYVPRPRVSSPPVICTVGRLSAEKGHNVLLDALARLRASGSEAVVELIGDGEHRVAIEEHARRLGVVDAVRFLGELPPEAVARHLATADVFCLPSFAEGLPVSIMEAMAVGTPVVTTYVSGIPELAVDRETAMVVPAGNAKQLAYALATVLADERLREMLTTNALRRVRTQHDLHDNVAALASLFAPTEAVS